MRGNRVALWLLPAVVAVWVLAVVAPPSQAAAAVAGRVTGLPKPRALAVSGERIYVALQDGDLAVVDARAMTLIERVPLTCCLSAVAAGLGKVWVSGNGVIVVDAVTRVVDATISMGNGSADALVVDAVRNRVYVALPNLDEIAVIDASSLSIVDRWSVADQPSSLALRGSSLYVSGSESVTLVDVTTGLTVASAIVASPGALVTDYAVIYVASSAGLGSVEVRDANNLGLVRSLHTGNSPGGLALNPGNGRLWVPDAGSSTTTAMMRSSDGIILGRIPIGVSLGEAVFDPALGRVWVSAFGSDEVVALTEGPGLVQILTPFEGGFMKAGSMRVTGSAPAGAPVTVHASGVQAAFTYASPNSRFSVDLSLPEGTYSLIATVPEEQPSVPVRVVVDLTPPVVAESFRTPANAAGWNSGAVTIRWSCTDALSGTATPVLERVIGFEGRDFPVSTSCSDRAGNAATFTSNGFSVDNRPPTVVVAHSPARNSFGWNRTSPVTVSLSCVDGLSGVVGSPSASRVVSGNTIGVDVTLSCSDVAGNVANGVRVVRIDTTRGSAAFDEVSYVVAPGLPLRGTASDVPSAPRLVEVQFVNSDGLSAVLPAKCAGGCGGDRITWSLEQTGGLLPGVYDASVRVTDYAGNVSDWSQERPVLVASLNLGALPVPAVTPTS